jgi:hypothetical protein
MMQCYKSPPSAIARMQGGGCHNKDASADYFASVCATWVPLLPDARHCLLLKLLMGEKVNLGPVKSASSLVMPSGKKERMATVKMERGVATVKKESNMVEIETTNMRKVAGNNDVVDLSQNQPKKSRPAADEDVEVVQINTYCY